MAVSFSFDSFEPADKKSLNLQGDATIDEDDKILLLTKKDSDGNPLGARVGRVLYSTPVQLYDRHGRIASFETRFEFRISSPLADHIPNPGDGLAFFITKPGTSLRPNSYGRYLGIYTNLFDGIVAAEFDTYPNTEIGDPCYKHIGININSIKSAVHREWIWQDGEIASAKVTYNSATHKLKLEASYPNSSHYTVEHAVDLRKILPERVVVGLSASTGQYSQINEILSWSFKSN